MQLLIVAARALAAAAALAGATASAAAAPLTLEEVYRIAESANPTLNTARAQLSALQGQLAEARAPLWNNPSLSLESSRSRIPVPGESFSAWQAGVSQTFEIAGQQGWRREAAQADLAAYEATLAHTRALVRAEVEQSFVQVLALQERAVIERETVAIVAQAADTVRRRREAGQVSRLDDNLARVEADRARNQLVQLDEQLTLARAQLAALLQLPPVELPEVAGELARKAVYTLEDLLDISSRRPQLIALARREEAARSRLAFERAARAPDVTIGIFTGRNGPPELRENIVGLGVSLPLPLFRRNQAGIGRATTELTQAQIEQRAVQRDVAAEVRAQWQRVGQLEARAQRLRDQVLPALEDNRRLSQTALREGEIGIAELLLVNRQVAATRRDLLDAQTALRQARIALERAAGWPPADMKEAK